jgi:hypothetical protein
LDIPVYNNIVESLHVLFTLYSDFKQNQHFAGQAQMGAMGGEVGYNELESGPGGANVMTMGNEPAKSQEWKM